MSDQSDDVSFAELKKQIREIGAPAAFRALVAVCENPKSSPQALSSAGVALFRASGLLNEKADSSSDKEPHEMNADEIQARIVALRAQQAAGAANDDEESSGSGSLFD